MAKKPLEIDCIAGSQLRDTQGEMLSIEGADISELQAGRGRWNDNHGVGFFNSIGRITKAKKIFKLEDCEDDRQRYYWDKVKVPYIYVRGYLYDGEDHPNAKAAAAILRNIHKADAPLQLKASVEGGVVQRGIADKALLAKTKIHSVALTFTPANNNTLVEPLSLDKGNINEAADLLLIKSVLHLAETNVPSFRHIVRDASATKVQNNMLKINSLIEELGLQKNISIPSKKEIIEEALEQKIKNNIIDINYAVKSIKENELLEKDLKSTLSTAALSTALAFSPQKISEISKPHSEPKSSISNTDSKETKSSHQEVFKQVAKQYPLLGAIGQIESSGGKNLKHSVVQFGVNKGHRAGGSFGMMPHSASFIINKDKDLASKYPDLLAASKDIKNNHHMFTERFNEDPQVAADFAISSFKRNTEKTKSKEMLVHSWLNGLKGSWNKYQKDGHSGLVEHQYVKKVMKEFENLNQIQDRAPSLSKAITAGYGGASSSSSITGGSVLQIESLDDGRDGFKYIVCDNCGKEQIYSKYQVKCRNCGSNFSFDKLKKIMIK